MSNFEPIYQSYLLRLWVVDESGKPVQRISLQCVSNGRWQTFANLQAMCAFLEEQLPNEQTHRRKEEK
ncbi:hypothetical protein [Candidatus Leptofilum sp.]|uniref:hypothetical protein n=1 Tax=Candidatus Leptofilum sp. TaxID=3241576 RepID=UPI003B59C7E4